MKLMIGFLGMLVLSGATTAAFAQTQAPATASEPKVLNNFVTELCNTEPSATNPALTFRNPRAGWVFIALARMDRRVFLDDAASPLALRRNPDDGAGEAMQYLPAGEHRVRVEGTPTGRLVVRAVPELSYCYYPVTPHISAQGPLDWPFLERYVLSHVNTIITRSAPGPEFDLWKKEGRRWVANAGLPGLSDEQPPAADAVYNEWAANPGVTDPRYHGMIVDEFIGRSAGHYAAWSEAVKRLVADPNFAGKTFYAWCGAIYDDEPSIAFSRMLKDLGQRFVWECYLSEKPTERAARESIAKALGGTVAGWRKALPGAEKQLVVCLGYLCAPPESLNVYPSVNYNVLMDMQFNLMANDPTFQGLDGLMEYHSGYADEEALRVAHRLFRHYCIEGNRTPLINDPYILAHLDNPDFASGIEGWRVEPAAEGSIAAKGMKQFSWLEGRYPQTSAGDQFLWMKRQDTAANRARQTMKKLEAGRVYSLKLISADLGQLDKEQKLPLSVTIDGVELDAKRSFQFVYPSCYGHETGPYSAEHPAYMNYHRLVFRAKAETAELTLSDWVSATEKGGPAGQELVCNFVEVQPYLEP